MMGAKFCAVVLGAVGLVSGMTIAHTQWLDRRMPYQAFDTLPHTDVTVSGATLHVAFAPGDMALSHDKLLAWVERSARAVATYYGRFPCPSAKVLIVPTDGRKVRTGQAFGYRGAAVRVVVGRDVDETSLEGDWIMVHEMVHLALPDFDERYNWLAEGLAVYIEPIARAQIGNMTDEAVWSQFVRDMPKGLPEPGDKGLDNTDTWASTYWGGAIFCLMADVAIRRETNNRFGLQDAMRGVLVAGGNHEVDWPIARVLAVADKTVGVGVLTKLYDDMRAKPVRADLDALWKELGIVATPSGGVRFVDTAPLAQARQAITRATNATRHAD
jgi:hypothetical protein